MSRGRPDHERRNLPFSASLRHRWWCDLVMRKRWQERRADGSEESGRTRRDWKRKPGEKRPQKSMEA